MTAISDNELMIMFQKGNVHAFELLFEKYRVRVFSFMFRMLNRDIESAEDLLQEIFVKICRAKEFYQPGTKFSTWLFTIARNHCLNFVNSKNYRNKRNTFSMDAQEDGGRSECGDVQDGVEHTLTATEKIEIQEILEMAICGLPDGFKDVFLLHALDGFTYEEVAQTMDIPSGTVKTHYHRARLILQQKVGHLLRETETFLHEKPGMSHKRGSNSFCSVGGEQ
jgi:RNA polymerase sigma-70 factor (ECF subfamily)